MTYTAMFRTLVILHEEMSDWVLLGEYPTRKAAHTALAGVRAQGHETKIVRAGAPKRTAALRVEYRDGYYGRLGAAELEDWGDVQAEADSVERIESLTGWGSFTTSYRVRSGDSEVVYMVTDRDAPAATPVRLGDIETTHLWYVSVGQPAGCDVTAPPGEPLELPASWWDLEGTVAEGCWEWGGRGHPRDWHGNTVQRIVAFV